MPWGESRFHEQLHAGLDHKFTWDSYALSYDRILLLMPYYQEVIDRHVDALTDTFPGPVVDLEDEGAGAGCLGPPVHEDGGTPGAPRPQSPWYRCSRHGSP